MINGCDFDRTLPREDQRHLLASRQRRVRRNGGQMARRHLVSHTIDTSPDDFFRDRSARGGDECDVERRTHGVLATRTPCGGLVGRRADRSTTRRAREAGRSLFSKDYQYPGPRNARSSCATPGADPFKN